MFRCLVYVHIAFSLLPALVVPAPTRWSRAYLGLNTTILRLARDNAVNISTERYAGLSPESTFTKPIMMWPVSQSWELGTLAEALTEAEWPRLSPFMPNSLFPPSVLPWYENAYDVLSIAET